MSDRIAPPRRRLKRVVAGIAIAVFGSFVLLVGIAAWDLSRVKAELQAAQDALTSRDVASANKHVDTAQGKAEDALFWTESSPWHALASIPWAGRPFEAIGDSAVVIRDVATQVVPPVAKTAQSVLGGNSGALNLDITRLTPMIPSLDKAAESAAKINARAQEIRTDSPLWLVNNAVRELQAKTTELNKTMELAKVGAQIAPSMLGGQGGRTYLLAFQGPSESRGTGGLLGGWAILNAQGGHLTQTQSGSNYDLTSPGHLTRPEPPFGDLGPDWNANWGNWNKMGFWRDSNFSPDFRYAAALWSSAYTSTFHKPVDGVIATDPIALGYILDATGPVTLPSGETITGKDVAAITLNTAYFKYPTRAEGVQEARKAYLQEIQKAVVDRLTSSINKGAMLKALGRAIDEGRLQVWSANKKEQDLLETTPLSHTLPLTKTPFSSVVINSGSGSKLDYYLTREISYTGQSCAGDRRQTEVKFKLTNTAPKLPKYPDYLQIQPLLNPNGTPIFNVKGAPGTNRVTVMLYETPGSKTVSATKDGVPVFMTPRNELGHPVQATVVVLGPGQSTEFVFTLDEPSAAGKPVLQIQPLADTPKVEFNVPECAGRR